MSHPFPLREDLIGKRILTYRSTNAHSAVRRGVIRASTAQNALDSDVKVLVEYDNDRSWKCRQWFAIYEEFDFFMIEDKMVWAYTNTGSLVERKLALAFRALVVKPGHNVTDSVFLEFLCDQTLSYQKTSSFEPFKVDDVSGLVDDDKSLVMPWINCHLAQVLLLGSPSLAKGHLVQVYNSAHGDSQWHRARVLCADDQTKLITLLDESKSELRMENAASIQIAGLPMVTDLKLYNAALKLAKKRPSEGPISPVDSKRTRKTEDQGTSSGQSEQLSTKNVDASLSTVHHPDEPLPNAAVQCLTTGTSQHVPATPPSASLSKSVESPVTLNSPPSVHRTSYVQSPVLKDPPAASMHPPQLSNSAAAHATNATSFDDSKKFCSLFRYRQQSPATFQKRSPAGFYHNSSAGLRYHSPPVLPMNRTNLSEPLQKTIASIASAGFCPKLPQNGLCSPSRTLAEDSSFQKVPENHTTCHEREEDGQLHIPVVIHSERERRWSSPGNRKARHASGRDGQNFFQNTSPVKSENLIVVDLVDDNSMQPSTIVGSEKTDASRGTTASQANQPRVSHLLNQVRRIHQLNQDREIHQLSKTGANLQFNRTGTNHESNRTVTGHELSQTEANLQLSQTRTSHELNQPRVNPIDQGKFKLAQPSAWIKEMERFVFKNLEEEPNRNQLSGCGSHIQTSREAIAKSGLKNNVITKSRLKSNISQYRSTLGSSAASTRPSETVKKLKQNASAQRPLTLPKEPTTKTQSSETTARLNCTKDEKLSVLKNLKSAKKKTLNPVRTVSRRVPSLPRIDVLENQEDIIRKNVVKAYEDETRGLVGVLKLLKIIEDEHVWPSSAEDSLERDATMAAKKRKKLVQNLMNSQHSESVNSRHSEPVNSRHSKFVPPRSNPKLHDCEIKIELFKTSISGEHGNEFESPSCVLSKKPLNGPDALLPKNSFVQEDSCLDLASLVTICRECKSGQKSSEKNTKILCRFFAFRRLNTTKKGACRATGFCSPRDADGADVSLWMPLVPITTPQIDINMAKYIIKNVGNRFCELVEQEKEAMSWSPAYSEIVWKRPVHGVREMCDVCSTTLFNVHWVCGKCGFVVCLDCFRTMTQKCAKCTDEVGCKVCERGHSRWPRCTHSTRPVHVPSQLMLTQIIPSDVLWCVGRMIHDVRKKWKMFTNCPCGEDRQECEAVKELLPADEAEQTKQETSSAACTESVSVDERELGKTGSGVPPTAGNTASEKSAIVEDSKLLASSFDKKATNKKVLDVPPKNENSKPLTSSSGKNATSKKVLDVTPKIEESKPLTSSSGKNAKNKKVFDVPHKNGDSKPLTSSSIKKEVDKKGSNVPQTTVDTAGWKSPKTGSEKTLTSSSALRDMIMKNMSLVDVKGECKTPSRKTQTLDDIAQRVAGNYKLHRVALAPRLLCFQDLPKQNSVMRKAQPIPCNSLLTTQLQYPEVAHAWLDDGRLLQLLEPRHQNNIYLFQQQWKHGQPVLVSNCQQYLNQDLWLPESFAEEFGDEENDLVDCSRKVVLVGHKMRRFWDGFERVTARLKDKHGQPMILKLKDWPPTEDFSELLPSRFEDLLHSLPMPEYTHRTGVFNLVSRLPEFFVRPDLGPKMYNAYGSALYPKVGSTNLHLDVSDAVNLILYVGIPKDDKEDHEAAAVEAMKEAGCCDLTMNRILKGGEKPGALWHIFDPQDSDKIRDLIHKVASEVGEPIGPHHDPIHDQSWYLDEKLRRRLFEEYAVECYTLVQCVGDAIFIPAGAPHQVRNLHSCIKAAEDFVSPENLSYCFKLTQEFRHLSDKHSNHEDKLQVKNIIYHAVKDAIAVLMHQDP